MARKHSEETKRKISEGQKRFWTAEKRAEHSERVKLSASKRDCSLPEYAKESLRKTARAKYEQWVASIDETTIATSKIWLYQYLAEKQNDTCSSCGFKGVNPYTGHSILELHHIDGDHTNWHVSNIVLICPNCHAMTDTFRNVGGRTGKGRPVRRSKQKTLD